MLYVVYQYNIISCVLSKKQDRNKINNLSDSSLFTFHLVSSFALGCTKMFFKPFSPTTSRSSENILLKRIDELLQPKEKMSKVYLQITFAGIFIIRKGKHFHQVIGIWKGKYAYLNLVYFDLAYIREFGIRKV